MTWPEAIYKIIGDTLCALILIVFLLAAFTHFFDRNK